MANNLCFLYIFPENLRGLSFSWVKNRAYEMEIHEKMCMDKIFKKYFKDSLTQHSQFENNNMKEVVQFTLQNQNFVSLKEFGKERRKETILLQNIWTKLE